MNRISFKIFIWLFLIAVSLSGIILGFGIYAGDFEEHVTISSKYDVKLKESVELNFSVPILKADYINGIKIYPNEDVVISLADSKRSVSIAPKKYWNPESEYVLSLPEGYSAMFTKINIQQFRFSTEKYPTVKMVTPSNGAKDVIVGVEDPIVVDFNKSTKGFFIKFESDPLGEFVFQNNPEKTQFKLLPKNKIKDGKIYKLKISIKAGEEDDSGYREIYTGSFETLAPASISWDKNLSIRLEQAKKYARAKITTGKYIDINTSSQIMTIFEDGKFLDAYLISSGKRGMQTPIGEHKIYNKFPRAFSKAYGLYMPYWMAILPTGKVGIHELPEWPGGYKEGANHLGIPVSHGCVRLGVGSAQRVYEWAEIGTPVIIH